MYKSKQKCVIFNNSSIIENEIVRSLRQTRCSQADEICALRKRLEESRLQTMNLFKNRLFSLFIDIKRTKNSLPYLLEDTSSLISRMTEVKRNMGRLRKDIIDEMHRLSEEVIQIEATMHEDMKIVK